MPSPYSTPQVFCLGGTQDGLRGGFPRRQLSAQFSHRGRGIENDLLHPLRKQRVEGFIFTRVRMVLAVSSDWPTRACV